jgi:predicted transcriptional regulator of viral defense system
VFSVRDAKKAFPSFDSKRLVEWQEKGYIKKLINKWYLFSQVRVSEYLLYRISNCLHHPSYISLESALSFYNLIPEAVYSQQAVSTRKTISYETVAGNFNYKAIKPDYFFGYQILHQEGLPLLMAETEKAIIDYFYFNAKLQTIEDIEALRLNAQELHSRLNWEKLLQYSAVFNSNTLNKRLRFLKKLILNAHNR